MNLSVSLLDPELYTAQRTCYRSSFLFTVSEWLSLTITLKERVTDVSNLALACSLRHCVPILH
jgi:hypothetical protein